MVNPWRLRCIVPVVVWPFMLVVVYEVEISVLGSLVLAVESVCLWMCVCRIVSARELVIKVGVVVGVSM